MMDLGADNTSVVPPASDGDTHDGKQPTSTDQTTIPVAASAASLILVLIAIILWYFLVRGQLRKKEYAHQRSSSHHSHQGSMRDTGSRKGSLASSTHGSRSPRSHHKSSNGSCRSKKNSPITSTKHSPSTSKRSSLVTDCTGMSPYCPHVSRMRLHTVHVHMRDSMDSDYTPDEENAAGPSTSTRSGQLNSCTCSTPLAVRDSSVVVRMEMLGCSDSSQTDGEPSCKTSRSTPAANCEIVPLVCSCRPVVSHPSQQCTCHVTSNPLDIAAGKLNQSTPVLITSGSDSDFPGSATL